MNDGDERAWIREGKVGYTAGRQTEQNAVAASAWTRRLDPDRWRLRRLWDVRGCVCLCGPVQGEKDGRVVTRVEHTVDASFGEIAYLKT